MLTSEENEAQEGQGKCPSLADYRSDSLVLPYLNLLLLPPLHAVPRRTRGSGQYKVEENRMVKSGANSQVEDRAEGKVREDGLNSAEIWDDRYKAYIA